MTSGFSKGLIGAGLFAFCAVAFAQQPPPVGSQPILGREREGTQVKAFDVKTASAPEIQQLLVKLFAPQPGVGAKAGGKPPVLVALDPKHKTIFVRGTAADVEAAGKVVAQVDAGEAKGPLTIIVLKNVGTQEVLQVLVPLQLSARVHPCPTSKVLVLDPSDPNADQIKAVVDRLEEENKPTPKKAPDVKKKN